MNKVNFALCIAGFFLSLVSFTLFFLYGNIQDLIWGFFFYYMGSKYEDKLSKG